MVDYYYDTHGLLGTCVQENGLLNQHHEIQGGESTSILLIPFLGLVTQYLPA